MAIEKERNPAELGESFPVIPLRDIVIFPHMVVPLFVGREKSMKALEAAMMGNRYVLLVSQTHMEKESPGPEDLYQVGTIGEVMQILKLPDGTMKVLVEGVLRAKTASVRETDPYYIFDVEKIEEEEEASTEAQVLMRLVLELFEDYIKVTKKIPPETLSSVANVTQPGRLADLVASYLILKMEQKQSLLEAIDPVQRLENLGKLLSEEVELQKIEQKLHGKVQTQIDKLQKEYYLREKMKVIQSELGISDEKTEEASEFREKLKKAKPPKEVAEKIEKEINRFEKMPPMAAESAVIRNYLEWMLELPWSEKTKDKLEIKAAEKILNEDHYGLEKIKERILEYLAVRKLAGKESQTTILCFLGPPGVGKTSLARSIAKALNRKFVRMSLGGVGDEAEIRGHRRTYVAAMPGRIVQGIKQAGSRNPVFLLDEIDKLSSDFRGNPAAALLEVLDPEQNKNFQDHYLEVPFDLSDVFFVCTANMAHTIPRPLLDRMEIIQLSGYTDDEKLSIAEKYILPKQLKKHGLTPKQIEIPSSSLRQMIRGYTREAGVRELERVVSNLFRKTAKQVVEKPKATVKVTEKNLKEFLGPLKYRTKLAEEMDEVGVVMGLAWTPVGGDVLSVETTLMKGGKGGFILTGQLGDVMKESARAAMSYIRSRADQLKIDPALFDKSEVHIHVPEGATPKDGPSAGITIGTALASVYSGIPVRHDVAMTGEITLRGKVLPIGGLKEKALAAHRAGITTILLPKENEKDLEDIPEVVRKAIKLIPVAHMDEVLKYALAGGPKKAPKGAEEKKAAPKAEAPTTRKRGRRPKPKAEAAPAVAVTPVPKKRGRPPKAEKAAPPKRRGRPPKLKAKAAPSAPATVAAPTPKRRGRPPKAKRRGRPRKAG